MSVNDTTRALSPVHQKWLAQQQQFKASGLSVSAFCQTYKVNTSTFYKRRERLAEMRGDKPVTSEHAPFIDAGEIKRFGTRQSNSSTAIELESSPAVNVRLDLGAGIVLTITRG